MAVPMITAHKLPIEEAVEMNNVEPKLIISGNTKIYIHSKLAHMSSDERTNYFKEEWEKGNHVLKEIARVVDGCQQKNE